MSLDFEARRRLLTFVDLGSLSTGYSNAKAGDSEFATAKEHTKAHVLTGARSHF